MEQFDVGGGGGVTNGQERVCQPTGQGLNSAGKRVARNTTQRKRAELGGARMLPAQPAEFSTTGATQNGWYAYTLQNAWNALVHSRNTCTTVVTRCANHAPQVAFYRAPVACQRPESQDCQRPLTPLVRTVPKIEGCCLQWTFRRVRRYPCGAILSSAPSVPLVPKVQHRKDTDGNVCTG